MSFDGKIQTAVIHGGNIYISNDYGSTWTPSPQNFSVFWFSICMNNNGQYQSAVAEDDYLYTSKDFGNTWIQNSNFLNNNSWTSICMSETGKFQTAVVNGYYNGQNQGFIFNSSNFGDDWNIVFPLNNSWIYVAMSNNGQYQTAVSFLIDGINDPNNIMGYVFNSFDYGVTWNKNLSLPISYYTCVSMSGSGQIQVIGINNCNPYPAIPGPLLISYDFGKTFNKTICPYNNWLNVSLNNIGSIILAASYQQTDENNNVVPDSGKMMISYDYGSNWQQTNSPLSTWTSAIVSKNSCIASATSLGQGIYIKI
jgi:photosystem II stability/assembly factor-like uncharacterized protein